MSCLDLLFCNVNESLRAEIIKGNNTRVQELLQKPNANVNYVSGRKDIKGNSLLHLAVQQGSSLTVNALIKSGTDVFMKNDDGMLAFHLVTQSNLVGTFLHTGMSVDEPSSKGWTLLHLATKRNDYAIVRALIIASADIFALTNDGNGVMTLIGDDKRIEKLLRSAYGCASQYVKQKQRPEGNSRIEHGVDGPQTLVSVSPEETLNIQLYNACSTHDVTTVISTLASPDIDVNYQNERERKTTPIFNACNNGHIEIVKLLIAAGADVDMKYNYNLSPLLIASENGNKEIVEILLAAGAKVNFHECTQKRTALHQAACNGHSEVIQLLLAAGAVIDKPDENEHTPLWLASINGYLKAAEMLADAGANLMIAVEGVLLRDAADSHRKPEVVQFINNRT